MIQQVTRYSSDLNTSNIIDFTHNEHLTKLRSVLIDSPFHARTKLLSEFADAVLLVYQSESIDTESTTDRFSKFQNVVMYGRERNDGHLVAIYQFVIGSLLADISRFTESIENYEQAVETFELLKCLDDQGYALRGIANAYFDIGKFTEAYKNYRKSELCFEETGNKAALSRIYNDIGLFYNALGNQSEALTYYQKSHSIKEEIGDTIGLANCNGNIGLVLSNLGEYDKALEYLLRSLEVFSTNGFEFETAVALDNIGAVYLHQKMVIPALEYYYRSLEIHEKLLNELGQCTTTSGIGLIYEQLGDYDRAVEFFKKSLSLAQKIESEVETARNYLNLGSAFSHIGWSEFDSEKAEEYLQSSLSSAIEMNMLPMQHTAVELLAQLCEATARYPESIIYYKKFIEIERSIRSTDASEQAEQHENLRLISEERLRLNSTEELLYNILPKSIANRIIKKKETISDSFDNVSIFFSDIVGFTKLSSTISPQELVQGLNSIFSEFDRLALKHGLEKIKTIGDAYMAVCGAPEPNVNHAECVALFALDICDAIKTFTFTQANIEVNIRIGLHCGSVVAGVIGENKYSYDLWGDAVNTASRMESHGEPGKIHCTEEFIRALSLPSLSSFSSLKFVERGAMEIKGKGMMKTYFMEKNNDQ